MACTNPTESSGLITNKLVAMQPGLLTTGPAFAQMSVYYLGICQNGQLPSRSAYAQEQTRYTAAGVVTPPYDTLVADAQCLQQALGKPPPVVPSPTAMEWIEANPIVAAGGAAVAVAALYWLLAKK